MAFGKSFAEGFSKSIDDDSMLDKAISSKISEKTRKKSRIESLKDTIAKSGGEIDNEEFDEIESDDNKLDFLRSKVSDLVVTPGEKFQSDRKESIAEANAYITSISPLLSSQGRDFAKNALDNILADDNIRDPHSLLKSAITDFKGLGADQRAQTKFEERDTRTNKQKSFDKVSDDFLAQGGDPDYLEEELVKLKAGETTVNKLKSDMGKRLKKLRKGITPEFTKALNETEKLLSFAKTDEERTQLMEELEFDFPEQASMIRGIVKRPGKLEDSFTSLIEALKTA